MTAVLVGVLVVVALTAVLGCAALQRTNGRLRARQEELEALLDPADAALLDDWDAAPPTSRREIVVVVRNVAAVAVRENRAALLLHKVRPSMLQRLVYDELARQLRERLDREGVEADVAVRLVR